jgi:membrane-bound lytic murein transglycosylase D
MMNSIDPYDITVDAWRDDRRDFWRATDAALDKLEYNYAKTGDWLLALAAYNCGLNKVTRTVRSSGINDYWELSDKGLLPLETRKYIPKLAAVAYICESRGSAGIPLNWDPPFEWSRIPLERSVDIRRLAREADVPAEILLIAHGELNYGVTPPPRKSYYLKTPLQYREKIENVLAQESELIAFKRYKVQSGDTLSEIAEWYKIPVSYIQEYNPAAQSRYLRIGQILLIPLIDETIPDRPGFPADNSSGGWSGEYTVQSGDSLWGIAMRHQTSPEEIAAGNSLPLDSTIRPGMRLIVPGPGE